MASLSAQSTSPPPPSCFARIVFCRVTETGDPDGFDVLLQHRAKEDREGTSKNNRHGVWDLPGGPCPPPGAAPFELTSFHAALLGANLEMGGSNQQLVEGVIEKWNRDTHPQLDPLWAFQVSCWLVACFHPLTTPH